MKLPRSDHGANARDRVMDLKEASKFQLIEIKPTNFTESNNANGAKVSSSIRVINDQKECFRLLEGEQAVIGQKYKSFFHRKTVSYPRLLNKLNTIQWVVFTTVNSIVK